MRGIPRSFILLALGIPLFVFAEDSSNETATDTPYSHLPSSAPAPALSPIPSPTPFASTASIAASKEAKTLLSSYQKAQQTELKAELHRQKMENRDLDNSQKARKREFEAKSKNELRRMFSDSMKREERRTMIQDNQARRKALLELFIDEKKKKKDEQQSRIQSIKEDQRFKLQEFKRAQAEGQIPVQRLWPTQGR